MKRGVGRPNELAYVGRVAKHLLLRGWRWKMIAEIWERHPKTLQNAAYGRAPRYIQEQRMRAG